MLHIHSFQLCLSRVEHSRKRPRFPAAENLFDGIDGSRFQETEKSEEYVVPDDCERDQVADARG
jgi:hypothetical protein